MPSLRDMQSMMTAAIIDHALPAALPGMINANGIAASDRVQIHQNNYALLLEAALKSTFPAVNGAVGNEFFTFLARGFVRAHPPTGPVMSDYGALFPAYIKGVEQAAGLQWLPDLAALEWARAQAMTGHDVPPVTSAYPVDLLWQGMQDPPLIDPATINLDDGPVTIILTNHQGTLYFTRLEEG